MKVTVGLVSFGGVKYLPYSLSSLLDQDYENIEYLVLDQEEGKYSASEWVKNEHTDWLEKLNWKKGPNLMHSGGMNAVMGMMTGDVFIGVSQDMLYPRDFVSKIVKFFEENQEFDFATVRINKWDFENNKKLDVIDSLGLKIDKKHYSFEVGQGKTAVDSKDSFEEVFGVTGGLFALRKTAIEKVKFNGQVFDPNLHYKNDVDLAYRLQWAGCRGALINNVTVYHDRFIGKNSKKPFWVIKQSLFGDWYYVLKNFNWHYSFLTHLKTTFYLATKNVYLLLLHPTLIIVFVDLWKKRREIFNWRKNMPREITAKLMESKLG